jgi:hypothetical protein
MSDCNKFTDLISGKEHKYSDDKVAELKDKYNKQGLKRVMLYKKYCVLGQIKHYNEYLIEQGLKKVPAKGAPKKVTKKSPAKKVKLPKCIEAGCPSGKTCNVKTGNCVKAKPKGADKIEVGGEEFFVTTSSQKKKVEDAKRKKASPAKKVKVPAKKSPSKKGKGDKKSPAKKVKVPAKKSPSKKSPAKKGKKSPAKKVKVPKCVESGCPGDKTCNVKSGRCVKNMPKGANKIEVAGDDFFVTTSSQKKKVEEFKGKKASPAKKVKVPAKKSSPKKKSSAKKKSPAKKVNVSTKKKSPPKKAGKKSPPKKVNVPKCLESGCPSGKTCNAKTGNCVKAKPKGAEKYEYAGEEFFVTTSSQKKKVRDAVGSSDSSGSELIGEAASPTTMRPSSGMRSARTPSPLIERLVAISEKDDLSDEEIDLSDDFSEEEEEDPATISREEVATINAQKKMILDILDKCK